MQSAVGMFTPPQLRRSVSAAPPAQFQCPASSDAPPKPDALLTDILQWSAGKRPSLVQRLNLGKPGPMPPACTAVRTHCRGAAHENSGFLVFQTHLYRRFQLDARHPNTLRGSRDGQRPKFRNHPQNVGEDVARHRDLCHVEANVARMTDDLCTGLDQLFRAASLSINP